MSTSILHVLRYFDQFSYPPTIDEVYLFLNIKISKRELMITINKLIHDKKIFRVNERLALHLKLFKIYNKRYQSSQILYLSALKYLKIMRYVPTVQYIGISGSLSMNNISKEGDIDLFIITTTNSLWLTRFILLVFKYAVIAVQKEIGSKLCFNLFFSEEGLLISPEKQNEYIAHELLQLKTLSDKNDIYNLLLSTNKWIIKYFPNYILPKKINRPLQESNLLLGIDNFLKKIQIWILKRNGYYWKEYRNQLWLIQNDFEEKALLNSPNKLS